MNKSMIFTIDAIDKDGVIVDTILAKNKVTANGIKFIAKGSSVLNDNIVVEHAFNTVFIGDDNTPVKYNDNGLKNNLLIIKGNEADVYFTRRSLYLPVGTYREIALGFNHPELGSMVFNRALLDKDLVINEELYERVTGFNITYQLDGEGDTSLSRTTLLNLGNEQFRVTTTTYYNMDNSSVIWDTSKASVIACAGPDLLGSTARWEINLSRNNTDDNVVILEMLIRNTDAKARHLTSTSIRMAGQVFNSVYMDANAKGILLQPNEQISLQTEIHVLPGINFPTKISPLEQGFSPNNFNYNLNYDYVSFNRMVARSGYFVNKETGERVDVDLTKVGRGTESQPSAVGLSDTLREKDYSYQELYHDTFIPKLSNLGVWEFYVDNFTKPQLSSIIVGNTANTNSTLTMPAPTFNVVTVDPSGRNTIIFTNHIPAVTDIKVYNRFTNEFTIYPFNDNDVLLNEKDSHLINTGMLALKYVSSTEPTRLGIWKIAKSTTTGLIVPNVDPKYVNVKDTLSHEDYVYPPANIIYDRDNETITGLLLNGNKLRIRDSVTDSILADFDVEPNIEFTLNLSELNMFVTEKYKFSAVNENGLESGYYSYIGFKSVSLTPPENIIYNETDLTVSFEINSPSASKVVLRRWNYNFYILETVSLGTNIISITEPLDPNGQYELIAMDIAGSSSEPGYIFGLKPEDLPTPVTDNTQPVTTVTQTTGSVSTANVVGFYIDPNSNNKWWERVTWFASVGGVTKEVIFEGIKSYYPEGHSQYNPMLTFSILDGEQSLYFGPVDPILSTSVNNVRYGYWMFTGGAIVNSSMYNITLWTNWIPFDGELTSNVYDGYRSTNTQVIGINRYTHQIIENKTGYIRRALGLNLSLGSSMFSRACPIDFDNTWLSINPDGNSLPAPAAMTAIARMYFTATAYHFYGEAIALTDIDKYSVLINDKEAIPTILETMITGGNEGIVKISWKTEDDVEYIQDLKTGIWKRSNAEQFIDNPDYDMVIDTIRVCTTAGYNQLRHPIQPDVNTNSSMVFEDNIRVIRQGTNWISVKAWVRPYRSGNKLMDISHDSTSVTYSTADTRFSLNFNEGLLDVGNSLEFFINGEPAELIKPTAPAKVPVLPASYGIGSPTDVLDLGGTALYSKNYPVTNTVTPTFILNNGTDIYDIDDNGNWVIDGRGDLFEQYRQSLVNPDDYLSHEQMKSALYNYGSTIALCVEDLPEELRTKKILVPVKWELDDIPTLLDNIANNPDELTIAYSGYNYTESLNQYISRLQNSKLDDISSAIKCGFRSVIIGHMEYNLATTETITFDSISDLSFGYNSNSNYYTVSIYPTTISMLGLDYTKNENAFDIIGYDSSRYDTEKSLYSYVIAGDSAITGILSKAIFGEERSYTVSETIENDLITSKVFHNGVFNVAAARERGLTGKYLIAILLDSAIVSHHLNSSYSEIADYSNETAYADIVQRLADKPKIDDSYIIGYMEIDLSKSDEELNNINDVLDYIVYSNYASWQLGYGASHIHCLARLTTTIDGWIKELTIDKYKQLDVSSGKVVSLVTSNVDEYTISDNEYIPRTIRSENYELQEIFGLTNTWVFTKDLVDRSASKHGHKQHKLFIKTKRFNSVNVFTGDGVKSLTIGEDVGHVFAMQRKRERTTVHSSAHYIDLDPRSHYSRDFSASYTNNAQFGTVLFNYFKIIESYLNDSIENILVGSYRGELIRIRKRTYLEADLKLNADGTNPRIYEFVKEDGTVVGFIDNSVDGNSIKRLVITNTEPGYHDFVFVVPGYISDLTNTLNNSHYYHTRLSNRLLSIGLAYVIFDVDNPPDVTLLNLVTPTNTNIQPYDLTPSYNDFEKAYFSEPAPAWDFVSTLDKFKSNYTVYINKEKCVITSEIISSMTVDVDVDGVNVSKTITDVVKYNFTTPAGMVASYYYINGLGCFKRELTNVNDVDNRFVIIFESNKAFLYSTTDNRYKPIYSTLSKDDTITDVSSNVINTGYNNDYSYVSYEHGYAYATNVYESMFVRPSFVNMVSNPLFIDYAQIRKDTALTAISASIINKKNEFESTYLDDLLQETFNINNIISVMPLSINNDQDINLGLSSNMLSVHSSVSNSLGSSETSMSSTAVFLYGMLTESIQQIIQVGAYINEEGNVMTDDGRFTEINFSLAEVYNQGNGFTGSAHRYIHFTLSNVPPSVISYNGDTSRVIPGITNEYSDPLSGYYKVDEAVKLNDSEYAINYTSKYNSLLDFANAEFPAGVKAIPDQYTIDETGEVIEMVHIFIQNPAYYSEGILMLEELSNRERPTVRTPYVWFQPYSYAAADIIMERSGEKPNAASLYVNHDPENGNVSREISIQWPRVNWDYPSIYYSDILYASGPMIESTMNDSYGMGASQDGFILTKMSGWTPIESGNIFIYDKNTGLMVNYDDVMPAINADPTQSLYIYRELSDDGSMIRYVIREYLFNDNTVESIDINEVSVEQYFNSIFEDKYGNDIRLIENMASTSKADMNALPLPSLAVGMFRKDTANTAGLSMLEYIDSINVDMFTEVMDYRINGKPVVYESYTYDPSARTATLIYSTEDIRITANYSNISSYTSGSVPSRLVYKANTVSYELLNTEVTEFAFSVTTKEWLYPSSIYTTDKEYPITAWIFNDWSYNWQYIYMQQRNAGVVLYTEDSSSKIRVAQIVSYHSVENFGVSNSPTIDDAISVTGIFTY